MRVLLRVAAVLCVAAAFASRAGVPPSTAAPRGRPAPGQEKILVPATRAMEDLARRTGADGKPSLRILERYGAEGSESLLLSGPADAIQDALAQSRGAARRVRDTILLRERTIDPARMPDDPSLPPVGVVAIVQFHGPIKPEWPARLGRLAGARVLGYVPHNAYLVWIDDGTSIDRSGLPLQWRAALRTEDRVSLDVPQDTGQVDVTVQIARAGDHDLVVNALRRAAIAELMPETRAGALTNLRLTLPADEVARFAQRPEVVWIEPFEPPILHDERSDLIAAGQVVDTRPAGPGYLSWLSSKGLDSLGDIIVDVTDSGIDSGGTDVGHPGLRGRIAYARDWTPEGNLEDCAGHGTHVAGTIAGGPAPGADLLDSQGYLPGLGMGPSLRLGSTRIFRCSGSFNPTATFTEMVSAAWEAGARIGNNSWGTRGPNYNTITAEYDAIVRDANRDPFDGDQPFLPVFSAGNIGPLTLSVGWPGTSKNVLTVGATEGVRLEGDDGCGTGNLDSDNANHLWSVSSRGPTGDGRIKPDLVAPGTHIQSLASTAHGYTGIGICNPYHPAGQQVLNWSSGTSHSAPHVAAIAAMASELYRREFGSDPSPAMIKACLISHARDLALSQTNVSRRPNMDQGWGRADLGAIADVKARVVSDQEMVFTATGQESVFSPIVPADASQPVIATLVWTDAPGTAGAHSWVNDLDLEVEADGTTYLGNVFSGGRSVPGGEADERNNVEMVVVPAGVESLGVRVVAANIAGDGLPSLPGVTDQDFALYLVNARFADDAGHITLDPPRAVCGESLTVRVADRRLAGFASIAAQLVAGADVETVLLRESPGSSGLFDGQVDVASGPVTPEDGILQTDHDVVVTASYARFDPSTGPSLPRTTEGISICRGAEIRDVRVARGGHRDITLAWNTDLPTTSSVLYGPGANRVLTYSDSKPVTEHIAPLTGLAGCTYHTAMIRATDTTGRTTEIPSPFGFSTGPGGRHVIFRDDMEALTTRWTHGPGAAGRVDDWELGFPAAAPSGYSGTRAWGTNLDGDYSVGSDSVLISPPIDLRDSYRPQMTFRHTYAITGGGTPPSQDDGGWVEVSGDGGITWAVVIPTGGYPLVLDPDNPHEPENSRGYADISPTWTTQTIDLTPYAGGIVRVRFHLWQDAAEGKPTRAGWYLDDVEVTAEATCYKGRLTLDAPAYGCSSPVSISLYDTHLAANPTVADTATVMATSGSGSIAVTLTETGPATAQFAGTLRLAPAPFPGALSVAEGDRLQVVYDDADAGGGTPATVSVTAPVIDCTPPPPPTGLTAVPNGLGGLTLHWTPSAASDVEGYRLHYDTDASGPVYSGTGAFQGTSPIRIEGVATSYEIDALAECARHYVTVTAFDTFGNESPFAAEVIGVPSRDVPCSLARLALQPPSPGCRETIAIAVSDANADPDLGSPGLLTAIARTLSGEGPVNVPLLETGPASGEFLGSLPVSPVPVGGSLTVSEGDIVELTYLDADDGSGQPRAIRGDLTIGDCTGPLISDVRAGSRGGDRAVIFWTTDEPSTSRLEYGVDASLGTVTDDPALVTSHAVSLTGLTSCGPTYFAVSSTDASGNSRRADDAGQPFFTGAFREIPVLTDGFETESGWTHASLSRATDEWERGAPAGNGTSAPSSAWSGQSVWGTDLDGRYEEGSDMVLVSPPFDLDEAETATLSFRHWFDITSIGTPLGFDDGGFVEVTRDGGATWSLIQPVGGYPDHIGINPYIPFGSGVYGGSTGGWVPARFHLDAYLGSTIRIRFHLFQDEPDLHSPGMGWYLDELLVTISRPCHDGAVSLDQTVYSCTDETMRARVGDTDLDVDPFALDTVAILASSDTEPAGEPFLLQETGPSTGFFEGDVPIGTIDAPGVLAVNGFDTITVRYTDGDDGTGTTRIRQTEASVSECAGPTISNVSVVALTPSSFRVTWETSTPADSRVLYGTTPALDDSVVDPVLATQHDVTVAGLQTCTRYFFTVASRDAGRNLVREDDDAPVRMISIPGLLTLLDETFDTAPQGWRHRGTGDSWGFVSGFAQHADGSTYERPHDEPNHDFVLESPDIAVHGFEEPTMEILHTWDFPFVFSGGDGGRVEGWNGRAWIPLTPVGGYPGLIKPESNDAGVPLGGYNGKSAGPVTSRFDLTPLLRVTDPVIRIRLRTFIEAGIGPTGAGWRIDRVTLRAPGACRAGRLAFDREAATCADTSVPLVLHDDDLDGDPLAPDVAVVAVRSSGGADVLGIVLQEIGDSGGSFAGMVPVDPDGAVGRLRVAPGDVLRADYEDEDDGTGNPTTVVATLPVRGCTGSVPRDILIAPESDGVVRVRWRTDDPATSEVSLLPEAGGPVLAGSDFRLATSHDVRVVTPVPCGSWTATIVSENRDGVRGVAGGPAGSLVVDNVTQRMHFFDDMEGTDPGWMSSGLEDEWQRGVPLAGPSTAFSGSRVFGTDLTGNYNGGSNTTLTSPLIDLTAATSPRLTFWHWYDIFSSDPPNSYDDSSWVEVLVEGTSTPIWIEPLQGYPDTTDADAGASLLQGTTVYSGQSLAWEKAVFDLGPWAGKRIRLRFRQWNDFVELIIHGITGFGWYLDDVAVTSPQFCHSAPLIAQADLGTFAQGGTGTALTITGSGFRQGTSIALGPGVLAENIAILAADRIRFDLSVAPGAPLGARALVVTNPDGQAARAESVLTVRFAASRADINGSGRVDGTDLALLAAAFGAVEGSSGYRAEADLDSDGVVDGLDLALLAASFGVFF